MGRNIFSRDTFKAAASVATDGGTRSATARSERQAVLTGLLDPLVDPAGFGVIRRSLPRFELKGVLFEMTVGPPLNLETRLDTTGSMGGNVDIALSVLPNLYESCKIVADRYDLQIATGIFNDVSDRFILCRPQFEMEADKIVKQLSLMVPLRGGNDEPEDPHYGLFGAAYLTDARIVQYGLKGYDFTVSDAPARDLLDERQLIRVFGTEVFDKVKENGHDISKKDIPSTKEVVKDLLQRSHAFFLQVGESAAATRFWTKVFPRERVVQIPDTHLLPQVQAAIIGLTEGTLDLGNCKEFLVGRQVPKDHADTILRSLAAIPLGVQAEAPNFTKLPKSGDLFKAKTDLWPIDAAEAKAAETKKGKDEGKAKKGPEWL